MDRNAVMLGTPRAGSNNPAFALGWLVGLTIAGGVMLVLGMKLIGNRSPA